jgi:hypothetical protein
MKWIAVRDKLPREVGEYLVANFNVQWVAMWDGSRWLDYDVYFIGPESHYINMGSVPYFWQTLPPLPVKGQEV